MLHLSSSGSLHLAGVQCGVDSLDPGGRFACDAVVRREATDTSCVLSGTKAPVILHGIDLPDVAGNVHLLTYVLRPACIDLEYLQLNSPTNIFSYRSPVRYVYRPLHRPDTTSSIDLLKMDFIDRRGTQQMGPLYARQEIWRLCDRR